MRKGWEYKKLGEVGTFKRGGNFSKKDFVEEGFPCIHYGQIHMKFGIETFKHLSSVPVEMVKPDRCAQKGDLVIAVTSEDDEGSCKCTAWMADYDAYVGGHAAIFHHTMEPKFVSYYFLSPYFQKAKLEYTHGFKVVEINPKDIAKISIPIPPLSEQKEIVEYLDSSFAKIDTLKANAAKSLDEAKALFQSALKEALEPKKGWEKKTLGEIAKFSQGLQVDVNNQYESQGDGMVRFLRIIDFTQGNQPPRFITKPDDKYFLKKHEIAIVRYGSSNGFVCYGYEGVIANNLFKVTIVNTNQLSYNYLRHVLKSENFQGRLRKNIGGTAMPAISFGQIKDIPIPFPSSIEVQEKIVSRLDSLNEKANTLQQNYSRICSECDALKQAILRQVFE